MQKIRQMSLDGRALQIAGDARDEYFTTVSTDPDPRLLAVMQRARKGEGTVWVDVGANCGLTLLPMSVLNPQGRAFGYEPHPTVFANLQETVALNACRNTTAVNAAIGAKDGHLTLYPGGPINFSRSSGSHVWTEDHWMPREHTVDVPMHTLDGERTRHGWQEVSLIKIDVEGFEQAVIEGGSATLAASKPLVYLEFNSWCLIALVNITPRDFLRFLHSRFAHVYTFGDSGEMERLATPADDIVFLHRNLTRRGCVDDLLCSHEPLQ